MKKPKQTKHTHEVLIKEGGSVYQTTIELTLKQQVSNTQASDEGYSTTPCQSIVSTVVSLLPFCFAVFVIFVSYIKTIVPSGVLIFTKNLWVFGENHSSREIFV